MTKIIHIISDSLGYRPEGRRALSHGNRQAHLDGTIVLFATRWEAESFLAMEDVES
jgi:hypothetical protein